MPDASFVEIQIETAAAASELVAAAVAPLVGGVELRDAETVLRTAPDRAAVVAMCAPATVDDVLAAVNEALALARAAGTAVDPVTVRRRDADEGEWRDKWKRFFRTTCIGRRFVVHPSWDPTPAAAPGFVVELDPGRAFGTGAHPSTRLVVGLMEDLADGAVGATNGGAAPAPARFLDLGCGSGILSIVAARLWPRAAGVGVDVDAESVACAGENLAANHVTGVELRAGDLDVAGGGYDLVLANIEAVVLAELAPRLPRVVSLGGWAILSGLLATDVDDVLPRYEAAGLDLTTRRDEGEWAALLLRRAG